MLTLLTVNLIFDIQFKIEFTLSMKGCKKDKKRKESMATSSIGPINNDPSIISELHQDTNQQMEYVKSDHCLQKTFKHFSSNQRDNKKQQKDKLEDISKQQKRKYTSKLKKANYLQDLIKQLKIKNIQTIFTNKIMRNSTHSPPVQYTKFTHWNRIGLSDIEGFELPSYVYTGLYLLSVIQILILIVIYSLSLVFNQVEVSFSVTLQTGSLIFYFIEILINLTTVKVSAGKKIKHLPEIFFFYLKQTMIIDLISLLILFIDIFQNVPIISYLRLFIVFKLPQCLVKIQKLQFYFYQNVYNKQYWELVKVIFYNLIYAHIIALFLAAMTKLNPNQNWMHAKGIYNSPWNQQYAWSFYWANTIMLTVGFGDLVANNYQEAICVSFIETFSCLMIAYNVSCVGSIISNIRMIDQQRCKNIQIFKKLTDNNQISDRLIFQISNYIEQSSKLKKQFNYEQDKNFIQELPPKLKGKYLREAHKGILHQLVFFRGLLDTTLSSFAEKIEARISHPQQIIRATYDDFNIIILRKGQIGYTCKLRGSVFNKEIADLITVKDKEAPFLTSLDFISKQRPLYGIKSLSFAVLLSLAYEKFVEVFRQNTLDYELYCFLRDKIRNIPDEFEVLPCEYCPKFRHFKFTCPRLHYTPLSQHILNKQLYREKIGRNPRIHCARRKPFDCNLLESYANLKNDKGSIKLGSIKRQRRCGIRLKESSQKQKNESRVQNKNLEVTNVTLAKFFNEKVQQIVSMEFARLQKREMFFDEVWLIACDKMADFRHYFAHHNPSTLDNRFSFQAMRVTQINKSQFQHKSESRMFSRISQRRMNTWIQTKIKLFKNSINDRQTD